MLDPLWRPVLDDGPFQRRAQVDLAVASWTVAGLLGHFLCLLRCAVGTACRCLLGFQELSPASASVDGKVDNRLGVGPVVSPSPPATECWAVAVRTGRARDHRRPAARETNVIPDI